MGTISFLSNEYSTLMNIAPYQYKMIRGIDFYQYCFNEIGKHPNVEVVYGDIKSWNFEKQELFSTSITSASGWRAHKYLIPFTTVVNPQKRQSGFFNILKAG